MDERFLKVENDVTDLKTRMAVAESNIKDFREDIRSIKDDTKWLRRTITGAVITTIIGGVLGGAIALIFTFN